jgi:hypothetical protein
MAALVPRMNTEAEGSHDAIMTSVAHERKATKSQCETGGGCPKLRQRLQIWLPRGRADYENVDDPYGWGTARHLLLR